MDRQSTTLELYEGAVDEVYIRSNDIVLFMGDIIRIVSTAFNIDASYEIKEMTQNITNPNKYALVFGDVIPKNLLSLLKDKIIIV